MLVAGLMSLTSQAQTTVNVPPGAGTLNQAIETFFTQNGAAAFANAQFVLERGGTYGLTGTIENRLGEGAAQASFPLTIVAAEGDGARPFLQPVAVGGAEVSNPFRVRADITLRGLHLTGKSDIGTFPTRILRVSSDNIRIEVDNCMLMDDGQTAFRLDSRNCRIYLTNSIVGRMGQPSDIDNGRVFDMRGNPQDTVWVEGNRIYKVTSRYFRNGGGSENPTMNYVYFNQNTFVNSIQRGFDFYRTINLTFSNNLVVNPIIEGTVPTGSKAVIEVDSVPQNILDSLNVVQTVRIRHNNFYWEAGLVALYDTALNEARLFSDAAAAFVLANLDAPTNLNEPITFAQGLNTPTGILSNIRNNQPLPSAWNEDDEPADFSYDNSFDSFTGGDEGQPIGWYPGFNQSLGNRMVTAFGAEVYPNPSAGRVSVRVPEGVRMRQLTVRNLMGQQVFAQGADQMRDLTLDLSKLVPGVYLLTVENQNGQQQTLRLVRQ